MRLAKYIILVLPLILLTNHIYSQTITTDNKCEQYFGIEYTSDGQQYMSLLTGQDAAEFEILFFENTEYRIATCSHTPGVTLEYKVYDEEHNLLFSSQDYGNSPYWNFKFEYTMKCFIEVKIAPGGPDSGIALLLIGFKNNFK